MQVREIMTQNPACCTPDSTLEEVAKLMVENDCGCIPIVDSHLGMKPIGTITDRDITIRTVATGQNPLQKKASDVMTTDVVTITPETSVQECGNVMKKKDIRRVLVIDNAGKCCGIVAQADIAQYGPNPNLISDVVNEISHSAPSTTISSGGRSGWKGNGENESFSVKKSLLSLNPWLPLLAGFGAAAAIKYYFSPQEKSEKKLEVKEPVSLPIEQKPDTFDKMASGFSNPTSGVNTENKEVISANVTSTNFEDKPARPEEIGRTAGQS